MTEMRRNVLIDGSIRWSEAEYLDWVQSLVGGDECFVQSLIEGRSKYPAHWYYHRVKVLEGATESLNGNLYISHGIAKQYSPPGVLALVGSHGRFDRIIPCLGFLEGIEHGKGTDPIYEPSFRNALTWELPRSEHQIAIDTGAISLSIGENHVLVLHPEKPSPNALMF